MRNLTIIICTAMICATAFSIAAIYSPVGEPEIFVEGCRTDDECADMCYENGYDCTGEPEVFIEEEKGELI